VRRFLAVAAALSDPNRVRAVMALRGGELCVCDIMGLLGLAPSTVSKHLAVLWEAGLVERRKSGRWQHYRLAGGEADPVVRGALAWMLGTLDAEPLVVADARRIADACCRPAAGGGAPAHPTPGGAA